MSGDSHGTEKPRDECNAAEASHESHGRNEMVCDRCDRCGRRHDVVWFAPSDIWNAVMRGGDPAAADEFGCCCPICFMTLAEERGVDTTGWLVTPFDNGPVQRASQVVLVPAAKVTEESLRAHLAEKDAAYGSMKARPSEDYKALLRGEITSEEYVRRLKADVDARLALDKKRRKARLG